MTSKYLSWFLLLFLVIFNTALLQSQTKRALIFAIANYPENSRWKTLSSLNDVPYIDSALLNQGFLPKDITIVTDAAATREGIDIAFKALVAKVQRDDIVVIHFSSHGHQIQDDNGDEADGLDECIVPYDAVYPLPFDETEFKKAAT